MLIKIKNKYEETKMRLREKILDGTMEYNIIDSDIKHSCIFCRKPIEGNIVELIERESIHGESACFIKYSDIKCFTKSQNNFYINNIAYPVN